MRNYTLASFFVLVAVLTALTAPASGSAKETGNVKITPHTTQGTLRKSGRVEISSDTSQDANKQTGRMEATPSAELTRILGNLEDVVNQLQYENSLGAEQVSALRRELALIYRDLEALDKRMAEADATAGQPDASHAWQTYPSATRELTPYGAQFNGWNPSADVSFEFGDAGLIILTVNNIDYIAKWTIPNAYAGKVEARVNSAADGSVVLTVTDADGLHEFMVGDGGLGTMSVRGKAGYHTPVKSAH